MTALLCALLGGAMFYFSQGLDDVWWLTWFAPAPLSVTCHHAPTPMYVGSFESAITPPIQASLPITVRHVTVPCAVNGTPSSISRYSN